jgi:hypothetical protein
MQRESSQRDIVASTPYRPPVPEPTRTGGRRVALRVASAGLLVGMTIVAGVALTGASSSDPVEVTFRAPAPVARAPASVQAKLVIDRGSRHVTLLRGDEAAWRARGPIHCVSGRRWKDFGDRVGLVAHAGVRLRDGAVVGLAGRVPEGTALRISR